MAKYVRITLIIIIIIIIISACPILTKEQYIKRHDQNGCTTALQHKQGNRGTIGQKNTGMNTFQNLWKQVKEAR